MCVVIQLKAQPPLCTYMTKFISLQFLELKLRKSVRVGCSNEMYVVKVLGLYDLVSSG